MTVTITDTQYDIADRIDILLDKNPGRTFIPSEIARKVGSDTVEVQQVLFWMVQEIMVDVTGNGSRRRYTARSRFAHLR